MSLFFNVNYPTETYDVLPYQQICHCSAEDEQCSSAASVKGGTTGNRFHYTKNNRILSTLILQYQ